MPHKNKQLVPTEKNLKADKSYQNLLGELQSILSKGLHFDNDEIAALSNGPPENLELWKLLKGRRPKQVKKINEIAKIVLD
jgi:hypothetical protein